MEFVHIRAMPNNALHVSKMSTFSGWFEFLSFNPAAIPLQFCAQLMSVLMEIADRFGWRFFRFPTNIFALKCHARNSLSVMYVCAPQFRLDSLKLAELLIEEHRFQWFSNIDEMMFYPRCGWKQPTNRLEKWIPSPFTKMSSQDKKVLFLL